MIHLGTRVHSLPLKHPFTISRGTVRSRRTLIVSAECNGFIGYGEATENDYYGVSIEALLRLVESVEPALRFAEPTELDETLRRVETRLAGAAHRVASFARCAIDAALHDLLGKVLGRSVASLWGVEHGAGPHSSFTIGLDRPDVMVSKLHDEPGWPAYKIKLGGSEDLAVVRELRRHTDAILRVDANGGWNPTEALEIAKELVDLGVELIEQPLPPGDQAGMQKLAQACPLPIFADESCVDESDVDRCAACFDGINIKLVKCGGLAPARRMIRCAREQGLKVMVGCMTESTVGISAAAQLLPLIDYADMDGACLLSEDLATGVRFEAGRCRFPPRPGLGIELNDRGSSTEN